MVPHRTGERPENGRATIGLAAQEPQGGDRGRQEFRAGAAGRAVGGGEVRERTGEKEDESGL